MRKSCKTKRKSNKAIMGREQLVYNVVLVELPGNSFEVNHCLQKTV